MNDCPQCGYVFGKPKRSNNQNRYYHGVVLSKLEDSEVGYTKEEWHEILKHKFLKKWVTIKDKVGVTEEIEITKSTTELSKPDFEEYMSKVRRWASTIGCYIPEPNEPTEV